MSVQELKGSMVDLLAQVNDRNLLEQIYEVVQEIITDNLNKTDWWEELPMQVQKELEAALEESKDPENLVAHDVVKNQFER
ncbi:MAG: hypothetical protein KF852_10865 [Saprospiraceae bacterium]|nr:hypothetical protein [Saprospiraceae bacterium]